jgi:hypothetical protein
MPHVDTVEGSKLVCLHLQTDINTADNQNLNAYIYQKTIINNRQGAMQKNSL